MKHLIFSVRKLMNSTTLVMGGSVKNTKRTNPYAGRASSISSRIKSHKKTEAIGLCHPLLPTLPKALSGHVVLAANRTNLMIIGGDTLTGIMAMSGYRPKSGRICYILENGNWRCHSMLSHRRSKAVAISMSNGIYVFGGRGDINCEKTYEFLSTDDSKWILYDDLPVLGFENGNGLRISPNQLILIGGRVRMFQEIETQILMLNTQNKEWTIVGKLLEGRHDFSSYLFNNKVIVTGGWEWWGGSKRSRSSTETLSLPDLKPRKTGNLITARHNHGMGLIQIKGKSVLIAFGGCKIDASGKRELLSSIEEWNEEEEKWVLSEMTLSEAKEEFGYCSILPSRQ